MYSPIERQTLVQRYHFRYRNGKFMPVCAWCLKPIAGNYDIHEYLVKRGHVKGDLERIMVKENMIPLHHECHMDNGQSREMRERGILYASQSLRAKDIATWYRDFVTENELQLPMGVLLEPKLLPSTLLHKYLRDGAIVGRREIPKGWVIDSTRAIDLAPLVWAGKPPRGSQAKVAKLRVGIYDSWNYIQLVHLCDEGYWYNYLLSLGG